MKRIILFIILANIYLGISSAQEVQLSQKHGWDEDYPLYGKIHIFTVLRYDVSDQFGALVKRLKSRRVITFNEHGHICESIYYNDQNQAQWTSFINMIQINVLLRKQVTIVQEHYTKNGFLNMI